MPARLDGLLVPDDAPPSAATLKRQILFFDSITLIHPEDNALVNEDEIVEKFSKWEFHWAPRNNFPRVGGYEDEYLKLISETSALQSRGVVRVARRLESPRQDAGMNWVLWATAISNKNLIEASAPDRDQGNKPKLSIEGYMDGLLVPQGEISKYAVNTGPAYEFPDHTIEWTLLARLRLGRALKFARMAQNRKLSPLALDPISSDILNRLSVTSQSDKHGKLDMDTTIAASMDVFDPIELEKALDNMTWADVARLRREVLPGVARLRQYLWERSRKLHTSHETSVDWAREQIKELQKGLNAEKDKLAEEWEKLRIAAVLKVGGVTGAAGAGELAGLISYFASSSLNELFLKVIAVGLVGSAGLSTELKSFLPARNKVHGHPLYVVDRARQKLYP